MPSVTEFSCTPEVVAWNSESTTSFDEETRVEQGRLSPDINLLPEKKPYRYNPDVFSHKYSIAKEESVSPEFSDPESISHTTFSLSPGISIVKDDCLSPDSTHYSPYFKPNIEISTTPPPELNSNGKSSCIAGSSGSVQGNEDRSPSDESESSDDSYVTSEEEMSDSGSDVDMIDKILNAESDFPLSLLPLTTKNEITDVLMPKPKVVLSPNMKLIEIGTILHVVENQVIIQSNMSGETRVLDFGTILLLQGPSILGTIFETIGPIHKPLYVIRFNERDEFNEGTIVKDAKVFTSPELMKYAFTPIIREVKGCDASNIYDEEVSDKELDFSDDEKESQHKKRLKRQRTRYHQRDEESNSSTLERIGLNEETPTKYENQLPAGETKSPGGIANLPVDATRLINAITSNKNVSQMTNTIPSGGPTQFSRDRNRKRSRGNRGGRGNYRGDRTTNSRFNEDSFGYNILSRPRELPSSP